MADAAVERTAARSCVAWGLFLLGALAATAAQAGPGPIVEVETGALQGVTVGGADQFLAVPYAAPPVGDLRWKPPEPAAAWTGVRPAATLPSECAQLPSSNGPGSAAEDCLYLNLYRPAGGGGGGLPVLVWFHGGGLVNGSGNQTDASALAAEQQVVVAMVNYRLTVFGFLALEGLSAEANDASSGNFGLMDQQAALAWLQRNVADFGGDPANVTIAGQSAGGGSVCFHLASPPAAGRFHRAIIHSGAFDLLILPGGGGGPCATRSLAEVEAAGAAFAEGAGCSDPAAQPSCLRALSPETLLEASASFAAQPSAGGALLPEPVLDAIEARRWNEVPILLGSTRDEAQLGVISFPATAPPLAPASYELFAGIVFGDDAPRVLAGYPAEDYADPALALSAAVTDAGFACPTDVLRRFLARRTRLWGFEFADGAAPPGELNGAPAGAYHTADVQYLFAYTPFQGALSPEQEALAAEMRAYWAAFARSGDPRALGAPKWPRFKGSTRRVLSLDPAGSRANSRFAKLHHCKLWKKLQR